MFPKVTMRFQPLAWWGAGWVWLPSASCGWGSPRPSRVHALHPEAELAKQGWRGSPGWSSCLWSQLPACGGLLSKCGHTALGRQNQPRNGRYQEGEPGFSVTWWARLLLFERKEPGKEAAPCGTGGWTTHVPVGKVGTMRARDPFQALLRSW